MHIRPTQTSDTPIPDQLLKALMGYAQQWDDNINPNASTAGSCA